MVHPPPRTDWTDWPLLAITVVALTGVAIGRNPHPHPYLATGSRRRRRAQRGIMALSRRPGASVERVQQHEAGPVRLRRSALARRGAGCARDGRRGDQA